MQIFFKQNLAMLAVPKTGTTALEAALRGKADILFKGRRKHMSAAAFDKHCAPFLRNAYKLTPERIAVIRDPLIICAAGTNTAPARSCCRAPNPPLA